MKRRKYYIWDSMAAAAAEKTSFVHANTTSSFTNCLVYTVIEKNRDFVFPVEISKLVAVHNRFHFHWYGVPLGVLPCFGITSTV